MLPIKKRTKKKNPKLFKAKHLTFERKTLGSFHSLPLKGCCLKGRFGDPSSEILIHQVWTRARESETLKFLPLLPD